MATWSSHPRYLPERQRIIERLKSPSYRFRSTAHVVFLCGGKGSARRETLRAYLSKHIPLLQLFYAEAVWDQIATHVSRGALKMESDLASLADLVIVIVESPGTFAELGAFSNSEPLRRKILAIVDEQYKDNDSFIASGPLRWIDQESQFSPTIYAPLDKILLSAGEVGERISRIEKPKPVTLSDLSESPKHLLFFLCDLVGVIHPATVEMVVEYIELIVPSVLNGDINIPTLIGLAVSMGLLKTYEMSFKGTKQSFLWPASGDGLEHPSTTDE